MERGNPARFKIWWTRWMTLVVLIVSAGAMFGAVENILSFYFRRDIDSTALAIQADTIGDDGSEIRRQGSQLVELRRQLTAMRRDISALMPSSQNGTPQVRVLAARLQQIEQREQRLEGIIVRDPAKALEMPLLQRDLQNLREANQNELKAIRDSVDRVYTLSQWLIGGIALVVFTLAATNLLSRKGKGEGEAA